MAKILAWLGTFIVSGWLLWNLQGTIGVLLMGWLFAYFLNPLVQRLEGTTIPWINWKFQKVSAVFTAYFLVFLGIGLFCFFAIPPVAHQLADIQNLLPMEKITDLRSSQISYDEMVSAGLEKLDSLLPASVMESIRPSLEELGHSLLGYAASFSGKIFNFLAKTISQIFSAAIFLGSALLVSYYVLVGWEELRDAILESIPHRLVDDMTDLWDKIDQIFGGYIKATLLASGMCFFATLATCGLIAFFMDGKFPYIILLSFFAAVSYPIPIVGVLATSLLAGFLGLIPAGNSALFALTMLVGVNIANTIIDRFVLPVFMSDSIGVSELFVLLAAFAGAELMGGVGMLVGVPVAAMGKTIWVWFYDRFLVRGDFVLWHEEEPESDATPVEHLKEDAVVVVTSDSENSHEEPLS